MADEPPIMEMSYKAEKAHFQVIYEPEQVYLVALVPDGEAFRSGDRVCIPTPGARTREEQDAKVRLFLARFKPRVTETGGIAALFNIVREREILEPINVKILDEEG